MEFLRTAWINFFMQKMTEAFNCALILDKTILIHIYDKINNDLHQLGFKHKEKTPLSLMPIRTD